MSRKEEYLSGYVVTSFRPLLALIFVCWLSSIPSLACSLARQQIQARSATWLHFRPRRLPASLHFALSAPPPPPPPAPAAPVSPSPQFVCPIELFSSLRLLLHCIPRCSICLPARLSFLSDQIGGCSQEHRNGVATPEFRGLRTGVDNNVPKKPSDSRHSGHSNGDLGRKRCKRAISLILSEGITAAAYWLYAVSVPYLSSMRFVLRGTGSIFSSAVLGCTF